MDLRDKIANVSKLKTRGEKDFNFFIIKFKPQIKEGPFLQMKTFLLS